MKSAHDVPTSDVIKPDEIVSIERLSNLNNFIRDTTSPNPSNQDLSFTESLTKTLSPQAHATQSSESDKVDEESQQSASQPLHEDVSPASSDDEDISQNHVAVKHDIPPHPNDPNLQSQPNHFYFYFRKYSRWDSIIDNSYSIRFTNSKL